MSKTWAMYCNLQRYPYRLPWYHALFQSLSPLLSIIIWNQRRRLTLSCNFRCLLTQLYLPAPIQLYSAYTPISQLAMSLHLATELSVLLVWTQLVYRFTSGDVCRSFLTWIQYGTLGLVVWDIMYTFTSHTTRSLFELLHPSAPCRILDNTLHKSMIMSIGNVFIHIFDTIFVLYVGRAVIEWLVTMVLLINASAFRRQVFILGLYGLIKS